MPKPLSATGTLLISGIERGEAQFRLDFFERRGVRGAEGTLSAPPELLLEAFNATDVALLAGGRRYNIVVRQTNLDRARIVLNGAPA